MNTIHNLINAPASTILSSPITDASSSFTVSTDLSTSGLVAPFKATIVTTGEIVEVGTLDGTTWDDISRGAEGTTAQSALAGAQLSLRITAGHFAERETFNVYPQSTPALNTEAMRAAIATGFVSVAPGTYNFERTGSESALFTINTPIMFKGNGATFNILSTVPDTCDVFHVTADNTQMVGLNIGEFTITTQTNTTARHGIHIEIPYSWPVIQSRFHNIIIGQTAGRSLKLTNPVRSGTTYVDGLVTTRFENMQLLAGLQFENAGDSVVLDGVQSNGPNIGYDITLVPYAGVFVMTNCNSITDAGPLKIVMNPTSNSNVRLINCNMEHVSSTVNTTTGATAYIEGGTDVVVTGCRFLAIGVGSLNSHGLRIVDCARSAIYANQLCGRGTGYALSIDNQCVDTYAPQASNNLYGTNTYQNAGTDRTAL